MTITPGTLESLISPLRLKLGDTNPASYRYLDAWLLDALSASVSALARWWKSKYFVDASHVVTRNTTYIDWEFTSPPVIQSKDEWVIVLMAAIIVKDGQLENLAWNLGSWRDLELSFSNIESGKQKGSSIERDWTELMNYLKPPIKRGVNPSRISWSDPT